MRAYVPAALATPSMTAGVCDLWSKSTISNEGVLRLQQSTAEQREREHVRYICRSKREHPNVVCGRPERTELIFDKILYNVTIVRRRKEDESKCMDDIVGVDARNECTDNNAVIPLEVEVLDAKSKAGITCKSLLEGRNRSRIYHREHKYGCYGAHC